MSGECEYLLSEFADGYPTKTNVRCWWCCHAFKGVPIGIPISYAKDAFKTCGCFCTFGCALAYRNQNRIETDCSLEFMRSKVFKDENTDLVVSAPPREMLKIFGGQMSIQEFRKGTELYTIQYAPLLPWRMFCDEVHGGAKRYDVKSSPSRPFQIRKARTVDSSN